MGWLFYGTPDTIRTCDLQSRSLSLYPAELRARMLPCGTRSYYSKSFRACKAKAVGKRNFSLVCILPTPQRTRTAGLFSPPVTLGVKRIRPGRLICGGALRPAEHQKTGIDQHDACTPRERKRAVKRRKRGILPENGADREYRTNDHRMERKRRAPDRRARDSPLRRRDSGADQGRRRDQAAIGAMKVING